MDHCGVGDEPSVAELPPAPPPRPWSPPTPPGYYGYCNGNVICNCDRVNFLRGDTNKDACVCGYQGEDRERGCCGMGCGECGDDTMPMR